MEQKNSSIEPPTFKPITLMGIVSSNVAARGISASVTSSINRGKYTEYEILVDGGPDLKWKILSRYSQFYDLHQALKPLAPRGVTLPELPSRAIFGNMEPEFIKKRTLLLDQYLCKLTKITELQTTEPLLAFLDYYSHEAESSSRFNVINKTREPAASLFELVHQNQATEDVNQQQQEVKKIHSRGFSRLKIGDNDFPQYLQQFLYYPTISQLTERPVLLFNTLALLRKSGNQGSDWFFNSLSNAFNKLHIGNNQHKSSRIISNFDVSKLQDNNLHSKLEQSLNSSNSGILIGEDVLDKEILQFIITEFMTWDTLMEMISISRTIIISDK